MNPAITNLLVSLGVMQIARKIDFEDEQILLGVRCMYAFSQIMCLGAYYYISLKIKAKNDTKVLKYVEPKSPLQQDPGAMISTTNRDYDLGETSKAVRGLLIGLAIMGFMHLYLKYTQPLFIQSILPLKGLYESQVVQIHLFGRPATGSYKRPFVAAAGFMTPAAPAVEETTEKITEIKEEAKKDK